MADHNHIERCHARHKKVARHYNVHTERNKVHVAGAVWQSWRGFRALDWTTGMDYWIDQKITFTAYNKIPFPVKLHPALDQSVMVSHCIEPHTYRVSSRNIFKGGKIRVLKVKRCRLNCNGISLHRTTHLAKQLIKMMLLLHAATK